MMLLNVSFLLGSLHQSFPGKVLCLGAAVATHYFLLACLAWMGVEAANMYQLLLHAFASSETCFMLKRVLTAWGIPAVIVGTCMAIDLEPYRSQDAYCVISSRNPFIYYIAFLGASCLIFSFNILVFIMVMRVFFKTRMAGDISKSSNHNSSSASGSSVSNSLPITVAQVRGAFTVMALLGVTWTFVVFAVNESSEMFPYVFCVCNSVQGFLIFVVRVLRYPEARTAWSRLAATGTFKKNRGAAKPAAPWCAYSDPKRSSHSSVVRVTSNSADSTSTVVFNRNMWSKGVGNGGSASAHDCPTRLSRFSSVGSLLKNCTLQKADKNTSTLNRKEKASSKAVADELGAMQNHKKFYSSENQVTSLVPDLYAGQEHRIRGNSVSVPDPMTYSEYYSRSAVTTLARSSNQKAHILFAYSVDEATPIRVNGVLRSPLDKPKLESFSTFQRTSPVPTSTAKVPELSRSWNASAGMVLAAPVNGTLPDQDVMRVNTSMTVTEETSFVASKGESTVVAS
ncbi:hypothetical protein HPB52_022811 [Rhipicephalus sanguineus]|uniref:G-protein coupled receptors family 2 profile 2 domain-containing protein n=2 Tax=Rhipicephalus sanguineus TaxID=34632 RepID=A0A9D4QFI8_RHISA|nr:hypothetical protein HPB52_022811 [Rhipicephalus sanguineus]